MIIKYDQLEICEKLAQFYGAQTFSTITDQTTHIILQLSSPFTASTFPQRYRKILQKINSLKRNNSVFIVSKDWIIESIASRDDLDEQEFLINLKSIVSNFDE